MQFLENIQEQFKPQQDKITMQQAQTEMQNWVESGYDYLEYHYTISVIPYFQFDVA